MLLMALGRNSDGDGGGGGGGIEDIAIGDGHVVGRGEAVMVRGVLVLSYLLLATISSFT